MLSEFLVYLRLGFEHITDPGGLDHLLFVAVLTASDVDRPRHLVWLVTAFTLGHSITLALATLHLVAVDTGLVELLIPVTIIATGAVNLIAWRGDSADSATARSDAIRYTLATGFGLIHGLGFSSFLRAALGSEQSILLPLFSFNVGLEVGQLAIVLGLVLLAAALLRLPRMPRPAWTLGVSGAATVVAGMMVLERI